MLNGKAMIILSTVRFIEETIKMSEYFSKPKSKKVKAELDLSNYATKADLKNATGADTSDFTTQTYLANLKSEVDKLDIEKLKNIPINLTNLKSKIDKLDVDKLVHVPADLGKLSNVAKIDVVKKTEFNESVKKKLIILILLILAIWSKS